MAWTTPRTWVANEIVRAATLNEQVRDNLNALRDEKVAKDARGVIHLSEFPREGAETDDSPRVRRALDAAAARGYKVVEFGVGTFTLATTVVIPVTAPAVIFRGQGRDTILENSSDAVLIDVQADYFRLRDMRVSVTDTGRTNYSVKITNVAAPIIERVYFLGTSGSWRAGIYFAGGSMGTVADCVFSHACIRVSTWDVKIDRCYVWGMTNEFCIGILDGAGNTTITNTDVVPPLTSTAGAKAAILVDGASGNPFNTKIANVYLDGNPSLDTGVGILIGDGAGATLLQNINANRMDSDCIVIDSAFSVVVDGYAGHTNNEQGRGAREIVVRQTGTQGVEKIRLSNISCLRTTAVTGTAGPAIEVESTVAAGQVVIDGADIKQPGAGGGYTNPEIKVPVVSNYPTQSIDGRGQVTTYSAVGSAAVDSGATGVTINLGSPVAMAYRARPGQIALNFEGAIPDGYRIQYSSDNQIFVAFGAALTAAATIHWQANLRR